MAQITGTQTTLNGFISQLTNFINANANIGTVIYSGSDPSLTTDSMLIFSMTKGADTIYYFMSAKNSASPSYFQINMSNTYSTTVSVTAQSNGCYAQLYSSTYCSNIYNFAVYANTAYNYFIQGGTNWLAGRIEQNNAHQAFYFGFLDTTTTGYGANVAILTSGCSLYLCGLYTIDTFNAANNRHPVFSIMNYYNSSIYNSSIGFYDFGTATMIVNNTTTALVGTNLDNVNNRAAIRAINLNNFVMFNQMLTIPLIPVLVFINNQSVSPIQAKPVGYFQGVYATPSTGIQNQYTFSIGTNNYQFFNMLNPKAYQSQCRFNGFGEVYLTNG